MSYELGNLTKSWQSKESNLLLSVSVFLQGVCQCGCLVPAFSINLLLLEVVQAPKGGILCRGNPRGDSQLPKDSRDQDSKPHVQLKIF